MSKLRTDPGKVMEWKAGYASAAYVTPKGN